MNEQPDTPAKHLNVSDLQGVTVIAFNEPTMLDAFRVTEVGKELVSLVEKRAPRRVIIDLGSIKMLSSQALGVLLAVREKLSQFNGKMVISGIDPRLYRVFKITNLQGTFEFFENNQAALAAFDD